MDAYGRTPTLAPPGPDPLDAGALRRHDTDGSESCGSRCSSSFSPNARQGGAGSRGEAVPAHPPGWSRPSSAACWSAAGKPSGGTGCGSGPSCRSSVPLLLPRPSYLRLSLPRPIGTGLCNVTHGDAPMPNGAPTWASPPSQFP